MTSSEDTVVSLILRFRDLVTPPGQTIVRHRDIADQSDTVWWGWWSKSGEAIPDEVFRNQNNKSETKEPKIYLLDSGHCLLWSAVLRRIHWDPNHRRIETPEKKKTPAYYRTQCFLAWFQLSDFSEISDPRAFLSQFSYHQVNDFFENRQSKYTRFYGKQVFSPQELIQQDRTIWFVRPRESHDPTHELSLLSERRIDPHHFPPEYELSKSWNLLWVSDLHFSDENHHGFPTDNTSSSRRALGNALEDALRSKEKSNIGGLLVSGDITWKATQEEFRLAQKFIKRITASPSRLKSYRIAICPGNHDIAYTDDPAKKGEPIQIATSKAKHEFCEFYRSLFYLYPNNFICSGRRYLLGESVPIEVACLNTSLLDQAPKLFQGQGFVGMDQLQMVEQEFRWGSSHPQGRPKPFRILMMHHHLVPTQSSQQPEAGRSYSMILDAGRVTEFVVRHRIDLVLHGHMHETFFARELRQTEDKDWHHFYVAGLGSTGVCREHRQGDNTFGVLSFDEQAPRLTFYSVSPEESGAKQLASHSLRSLVEQVS